MLHFHIIGRRSFKPLVSTAKTLFNGTSSIQCRGRPHAASVPSGLPKPRKPPNRPSKHERRAMVERYVTKYRETHAGKFPFCSEVQKQLGGSYYVIRKIIQELEYNSKISSSSSSNVRLLGKEQNVRVTMDKQNPVGVADVLVHDMTDKNLGIEEELQTERVLVKDVVKTVTPEENVNLVAPQSNPLEAIRCKDDQEELLVPREVMNTEDSRHKEGSPEQEKNAKDISSQQTDVAELTKESTLWRSLKSFADGIVNIWRKL